MAEGLTAAGFETARYPEIPVADLLRAAALGWIGVDRRLIRSILDRGEAGMAGVVEFSRDPGLDHRVDIEPVLIDLFRQSPRPEALDFFLNAIRKQPDEVPDDLVQALLPLGQAAVDGLLSLYEELGEEEGGDVAFLLAGLRIRDPRVLPVLLDRLEFDAADGAFCLGLYGDPAAKPALEAMLEEIPEGDKEQTELHREIAYAIEQLDAPATQYDPEPFDILKEYPEKELPDFDVLTEPERIELMGSSDPEVRAEAAYSFFNAELTPKSREALLEMAKSDADAAARGRAWESLADAADDKQVRAAMLKVLNDHSRPVEERGGAAVGLYGFAEEAEPRKAIEALYQEGGMARAKALEAMWRSLWKGYAKYFGQHVGDPDPAIVHQALRGAGYFRLTGHIDKIAQYFEHDDFRDDALFAYALASPGETSRGRARGLLRKIDSLAHLTPGETRLVMFGIDERLRLHGLGPVFAAEPEEEEQPEQTQQAQAEEPGRNDPCPCGSGKKFKKCHGK